MDVDALQVKGEEAAGDQEPPLAPPGTGPAVDAVKKLGDGSYDFAKEVDWNISLAGRLQAPRGPEGHRQDDRDGRRGRPQAAPGGR